MRINKGITLVALIITIIVMLILVGVSISVLINSDLIGTAQNAGDRTESAYGEESSMGGITVGNKNYDNIQDYIDGNGWTTIFEGKATTVNGQVLLSEDMLFEIGDTYKITVESEEYSGTVTATSILMSSNDSMTQYILFGVVEGEAITFNSLAEVQAMMATVEDGTGIGGINVQGTGSMIGLMSIGDEPTCEYTITKIQKKEISFEKNGTKVFEGELTPTENENTIEVPFTFELTKKYRFCYER